MCCLGCKPTGRNLEQHDTFFSIGESIVDIVPDIKQFWPEASMTEKFHIDSYRQVTYHDGYIISVKPREEADENFEHEWRPFFINLGGYKQGEFGEFHYADIFIAETKGKAVELAKQTAFFKHTGYKGAESHIDDKWGIDVDDIYDIGEILPAAIRKNYSVWVMKATDHCIPDEIHSGFNLLSKF